MTDLAKTVLAYIATQLPGTRTNHVFAQQITDTLTAVFAVGTLLEHTVFVIILRVARAARASTCCNIADPLSATRLTQTRDNIYTWAGSIASLTPELGAANALGTVNLALKARDKIFVCARTRLDSSTNDATRQWTAVFLIDEAGVDIVNHLAITAQLAATVTGRAAKAALTHAGSSQAITFTVARA